MSLDLAIAPGDARGEVAGWSWTRVTSVLFMPFTTTSGPSHIETFDAEWHSPNPDPRVNNDPFVGELAIPTTSQPALFGGIFTHERPTAVEGFERHWRLPSIPAADRTHVGNEETLFSWSGGVAVVFASGAEFEGFEQGWSSNETFVWILAPSALVAALFEGAPVDDFESWTAGFAFTMGATTPASFAEGVASQAFEDFSQVAPDLAITFAPPSTITAGAAPAFLGGQLVSFYNGGGAGSLPPEIDSRLTYYLLSSAGDAFTIAMSVGGSALVFSAASGNNFVRSDPRYFWTLTDVGL